MNGILNTRDILNAHLYPTVSQDVRRKDFPYYDTLTIATGQTEYYFFTTPLGNQFLRNKELPLAGTEIFFVEEITALLNLRINTTANIDALNSLLQQSYLKISVDNRQVCKLPGLDFIQYVYSDAWSDQVVVTANQPRTQLTRRKLPIPIILNSTSAFEFKLVIPTATATAFNNQTFRLVLHGLQLDKLESFYWDNLKSNQFQQVPVTYYYTQVIPNGNEQTFQLFANPALANNLFSQSFPLSDIQTFAIQNIEVFVNQPDTPIAPSTIYFSRLQNILKISVDDVFYYNANLQDMLSLFAGLGSTLTTTPNLDVVNIMNVRNSKTLRVPLQIPANANINISLTQPAGSLGITGEITVALRGIETRRVA